MLTDELDHFFHSLAAVFPAWFYLNNPINLRSLVAIVLVSLICGAVGSLVVGNRMAFFSDALGHCAFAGVALALLIGYIANRTLLRDPMFYQWVVPTIMVGFGILIGVAIAFVRETTGLASDTVIGVFFAGAIGMGGMLLKAMSNRRYLNPEHFMFGDLVNLSSAEILILCALAVVTLLVLGVMYNWLLFTSFNSSLARSRQIPVRLCNYLFIVLLGVIINLCLRSVGALLINAFLIVPAATAANVCRTVRQQFWMTLSLCLFAGIAGQWLSSDVPLPDPSGSGQPVYFGPGGTIVVISVLLFSLSLLIAPRMRGTRA